MSASMIDSFRRWYDYEKDVHAKVLTSLGSVPENRRQEPAFQKATSIMGHIIAARHLWLFRFGILPDHPTDFFPKGLSIADLSDRETKVEGHWQAYLNRLDEAEFNRSFEYQSLDGGKWRNTVGEILTQLFGHSWYHRGQIASLVRAAGGEPAITDFVFWAREAVGSR
jgi:uncharacterized damage-inducible protein DinB